MSYPILSWGIKGKKTDQFSEIHSFSIFILISLSHTFSVNEGPGKALNYIFNTGYNIEC